MCNCKQKLTDEFINRAKKFGAGIKKDVYIYQNGAGYWHYGTEDAIPELNSNKEKIYTHEAPSLQES